MESQYFTEDELSCNHCRELIVHQPSIDMLNTLRRLLGGPVILSSAYRCAAHNEAVGGGVRSMHLRGRAFDVTLVGHSKADVIDCAVEAGFTGLGINYDNFVHVDTGKERRW